MNLRSLAKEEDAVMRGVLKKHSDCWNFSESAVDLVQDMMAIWGNDERYVNLVAFLWHMHVSLSLALLSAARGHETQSVMMMRQAIEGGVLAAYSLENPSEDLMNERQMEKVRERAYKWLESAYPQGSRKARGIKNLINQGFAHPTFFSAVRTWHFAQDGKPGGLSYFDRRDDAWIDLGLYRVGDVAVGFVQLIGQIGVDKGLWNPPQALRDRVETLSATDTRLHRALRAQAGLHEAASGTVGK